MTTAHVMFTLAIQYVKIWEMMTVGMLSDLNANVEMDGRKTIKYA